MHELYVVILAAGQGTRMQSNIPKVLHTIGGQSMLGRVIQTASQLKPKLINVVVGFQKEKIINALEVDVNWVEQEQQLGTGHAVKTAAYNIPNHGYTLVLYGDVPLIDMDNLNKVLSAGNGGLALLTDRLENPKGYGRVVRDEQQQVLKIVEEKDTNDSQKLIQEINTGIYAIPNQYLHSWLADLDNNNAQREYYLTDIVEKAHKMGVPIQALTVSDSYHVMGVNDKLQLANLERIYQLEKTKDLLKQGLTLRDPARFDLRGKLEFGKDVSIDVNVVMSGNNHIGNNVQIGANCVLNNVQIADNVRIHPFSHLDQCHIAAGCEIGPYARLRPKAKLAEKVHVGNFVEIKNSVIGCESKVNHLTYIGDTEIGTNTNIGAGTITCNYDGVNKHRTVIGNECRIGSGTMLVAPVTIADKATIGAGSVITKDCPENQLTLSRAKQVSFSAWNRPEKTTLKESS